MKIFNDQHEKLGGGLDGPLRCLPRESTAPAKPALEAERHHAGAITRAWRATTR
jgi:hypothetical protein